MSPNAIKAARQTFGATQEQFAHLLGVSARTFQRYESGDSPIPAPVAKLVKLYESAPIER